jgi:hypothetical protein
MLLRQSIIFLPLFLLFRSSSSSSISPYKQQQYAPITPTSSRARNNHGSSTKSHASPTKPVVFTVRL